jgi:hypothetical protein
MTDSRTDPEKQEFFPMTNIKWDPFPNQAFVQLCCSGSKIEVYNLDHSKISFYHLSIKHFKTKHCNFVEFKLSFDFKLNFCHSPENN